MKGIKKKGEKREKEGVRERIKRKNRKAKINRREKDLYILRNSYSRKRTIKKTEQKIK